MVIIGRVRLSESGDGRDGPSRQGNDRGVGGAHTGPGGGALDRPRPPTAGGPGGPEGTTELRSFRILRHDRRGNPASGHL